MAKPENGLWKFLRARMPVGTHASRIESLDTAPGFPDVHYTFDNQSGTMELKCQEFPTGEFPFKDELRKSQREWIREELTCGGKVILVLQCRQMVYFLEGQYWDKLDKMTELDINEKASVTWERGGQCDVAALQHFMREP